MSHFTAIKTHFQNLFYLEKALNRLNIICQQEKNIVPNSISSHTSLVIPQSNGYDVTFCWNGEEYNLVADLGFWKQSCPVKNFTDQIAQQYAGEVIIGEGQKIGFQPVRYEHNSDGSNTLVLERWSDNQ
jgi:hypothetical protein